MTDPFAFDGQQTIFPLLDPDLFAQVNNYNERRLAANRELKLDVPAWWAAVDAYRMALSLDWQTVADDSGVSASTLSRLNKGYGKPALPTFLALCLWMGITDTRRFLRPG